MGYVITAPCIGVKDGSCVDVCPMEAIHASPSEPQLYIDPEMCTDCGACVTACPVEAVFADSDVPEKWTSFIELNASKSREHSAADRPNRRNGVVSH